MNILDRDTWDRNRGLQHGSFQEALVRARGDEKDPCGDGVRKVPGTDIADPYGLEMKPANVPVWDHAPSTPEEEAIYYGVHIHSESNPLGLHSHVIGGKPSGGHSHGPQNRYGAHSHTGDGYGLVDGSHVHDGENCPAGEHCHEPSNFG